jgi:hypothetical protein
MCIECWLAKVIKYIQSMKYSLLFYFDSGCTNAPQCYVICALPILHNSTHVTYSCYYYPLFFSDFEKFRKIGKHKISWKSFQWGPSCSMRAARRTGQLTQERAQRRFNRHFSQLYERAQKNIHLGSPWSVNFKSTKLLFEKYSYRLSVEQNSI